MARFNKEQITVKDQDEKITLAALVGKYGPNLHSW